MLISILILPFCNNTHNYQCAFVTIGTDRYPGSHFEVVVLGKDGPDETVGIPVVANPILEFQQVLDIIRGKAIDNCHDVIAANIDFHMFGSPVNGYSYIMSGDSFDLLEILVGDL